MPNFDFDKIDGGKIKRSINTSKGALLIENILEKTKISFFLNNIVKKMMIWKIKNNPKTKKPGADIRFSDQALVFLPKPKRELLLKKTLNLMK